MTATEREKWDVRVKGRKGSGGGASEAVEGAPRACTLVSAVQRIPRVVERAA